MFIPRILGFQGLLYVFLLVIFLVIHHMWRTAEVKKEEIMRLVDMASKDAAMAEMEALSECSFIPVSVGYKCAMCYPPATMRCFKCKAIRYWFVFFLRISAIFKFEVEYCLSVCHLTCYVH